MNLFLAVRRKCLIVIRCQIGLLLLAFTPAWCAPQLIIYPQAESANDNRSNYPLQLLELALTKAGVEHVLQPSSSKMPQGRALIQLAAGHDVDVVWSMTSRQREQDLLPIRIPIDKGLLGWRIF